MAIGYLYGQLVADARAKDAITIGKKPTRGQRPRIGPALTMH